MHNSLNDEQRRVVVEALEAHAEQLRDPESLAAETAGPRSQRVRDAATADDLARDLRCGP